MSLKELQNGLRKNNTVLAGAAAVVSIALLTAVLVGSFEPTGAFYHEEEGPMPPQYIPGKIPIDGLPELPPNIPKFPDEDNSLPVEEMAYEVQKAKDKIVQAQELLTEAQNTLEQLPKLLETGKKEQHCWCGGRIKQTQLCVTGKTKNKQTCEQQVAPVGPGPKCPPTDCESYCETVLKQQKVTCPSDYGSCKPPAKSEPIVVVNNPWCG